MNRSSRKTLLNLISIAIILSCVIMCADILLLCVAPYDVVDEMIGLDRFSDITSDIWNVFLIVLYALVPTQIVLMLGIFVFKLRNLREFLGYYLGAFLSLITCAGSAIFVLACVGWALKDF